MKFQCSKCGICCKKAGELGYMPSRKDGSCIYLNKNNECKIYKTRPLICNINKIFDFLKERKIYPENFTRNQHFKVTSEKCNELIDENNIDKKYRLDPNIYNNS